jgi:3-hydroxyisobutyrate dehydrogenase-like beta-hydroxyacid dehydrogenase
MNEAKDTVGVVGLGIMGSSIARNIAERQTKVVGFDVDPKIADALRANGIEILPSPAAVAERADLVLLSLPSVGALDEVVSGATGLTRNARPSLVVAELSTLPIAAKERSRDALARSGATLLDCPLSGTGAQARTRDLIVYASGDEAACRRCVPFFDKFSKATHYLGPFGDGMKMKFVANLLVTIHNVAAAEALVMAEKCGLDPGLVYRVITSGGAASSRMFEVRGPLMVDGKYEPVTMKNEVYQKDLALIAEFAAKNASPTPLFSASLPLYAATIAQGMGLKDTAAVHAVLARMAGIER